MLLERIRSWLEEKPFRADAAAILALTALWAFYFWRVPTPNLADRVSLPQGDFSGQFVAFGAYQARRLLSGEIPLWNPYNYAGSPFLADTQSAVFYPPRLVTIVISHLTGGWSYAALQFEAIAHYWLGALWMYLLVRTITRSRIAGLVSAVILAYGGYLTGYPPLQLAVLEAGIWLPLALLGVYKASEGGEYTHGWRIEWLALSALALGVSLLAGHPQTSLFLSYALIATMIHRAARQKIKWLPTLLGVGGTVGLGFGLAAVQVLPGLEYTRLTIRAGYGFDALAGGFPFSDLIVFLIPNVVTVWSPLYSGIAALALAGVALWRRHESARLWGVITLVAIGLSFGGATVIYKLAYLLAPGFSMFRGQERAAYLIAHGVAILAGMGVASLQSEPVDSSRLVRVLGIASAVGWVLALEAFIADALASDVDLFALKNGLVLLAVLATLTWIVVGRWAKNAGRAWWPVALIALVVFDLFSATMDTNWEPVPPGERELFSELVPVALQDRSLYRVDGQLGLGGNYGSMVGLQDIRGISPLRLGTLDAYLTSLPQYRLHQLLAVKYVFTDWQQLEVPSTIRAEVQDDRQTLYLHQIDDPMPRAWMAYRVMVTADSGQALGWLSDPGFDMRGTVILEAEPGLKLPSEPPADWQAQIDRYESEHMVLRVDTPTDGVLVVSEMDYPGWQAWVDGQRVEIRRANAGLRALLLGAGEHRIELVYRPLSVTIGAIASMISAGAVLAGALSGAIRKKARAKERNS